MKKARNVLIFVLVLILVGCFISTGVLTDWGKVNVSVIRIATEDGKTLSANLFVPENAANDTPAPAILVMHGYVNQKEHQNPLAIELSRRGYVVLALDMAGHGYSDETDADGKVASGTSTDGAADALRYLVTLPFVDAENVAVLGHSLGGINAYCATIQNPGLVKTLIMMGSCPIMDTMPDSNLAIVFDEFDEFTLAFWPVAKASDIPSCDPAKAIFNTTDTIEIGKVYGSFEDNTARELFTESTTHPGEIFRTMPIGDAIQFLEASSPSANSIDPYSQVWQWQTFGTLLGLIGFWLSIFALGSLLLKTRYFVALAQDPSTAGSIRLRKAPWWIVAAVTSAVPALTFLKYYTAGAALSPSRLFPIKYSNALIVWALVNAAIMLIIFLIIHFASVRSKRYRGSALGYGLSTNSEKSEFKWSYIGKTLLLALIVLGIPYFLLFVLNRMFNYDFRFIIIPFHPMDTTHFWYFFVYLIPLFLFFFISGLFVNSRLSTKEFTGWKVILPYITGFLITVGGLIVLYLLIYIPLFATGELGFTWSFPLALGSVAIWQMIPMLGFTSIISTYFYRKTSKVYLGAFISAMLIAWYTIMVNMIEFPL